MSFSPRRVRAVPPPAAQGRKEYVNRVLLRDMAELAGDSELIRSSRTGSRRKRRKSSTG